MRLEGYSGYEIDPEAGTIWSYKTNRYVGAKNERGYIVCCLRDDDGKEKMWKLHRLVWTVVNGEIPDGMQVNHIDENKDNNSITNLNLLTNYENCNWGTHNERVKTILTKKIWQTCCGI